ncbi:MAG: glycosyltransferase family 4 protein [Candidatus Omnitrophica bacterium]|nr:glycosyltransferase family 4 protein [Candidatus Omnitrophota bacterium]
MERRENNLCNVKKPRLLLIGPLQGVSGHKAFICYVLKSSLAQKYNMQVLDTYPPFISKQYSFLRVLLSLKFFLALILKLLSFRPQLVHTTTASYGSFWEKTVMNLISKLFGCRTLVSIAEGRFASFYKESNNFVNMCIRLALWINDVIIVLSPYWQALFCDTVLYSKTKVVENGVNENLFYRKFSFKKVISKVQILYVGFISPNKGLFTLLDAMKEIILNNKNVSLILVGDEDSSFYGMKERITSAYAQELGNIAKFVGRKLKGDVIKYFSEADIFVLPSYFEGMPFSILEAMAAGLPVISTRVGSIPEIVEEGTNGFLVDPGDHKALASKMSLLISDRPLRLRLGTNNILKIKQRYTIDIMVGKLDKIYQELLDKRR